MSKSLHIIVGLVLSLNGASAFAYHLGDHSRIARQAYTEFTTCFPEVAQALDADLLVQSDLNEDLNLVVKELMYSHYYNPNHELDMWRYSSMDRVHDLSPSLQVCRVGGSTWDGANTADLGHVIHHLQDMTVPSHVVPVSHSAWDGFETYEDNGEIGSDLTCAEIARGGGENLERMLQETALDTLAYVKQFKVSARNNAGDRQQHEVRGTDFWVEASSTGFGSYGAFGNAFGSRVVSGAEGDIAISDGAYQEFKTRQMKRAVRATLRALSWAFPRP